jgi:multisubunit Na+/H+ antiporter MnhB subunit
MGYAINVGLSIPMAVIIYMLTEKLILHLTCNDKFETRVQKSFIVGFILGLTYITLGLTIFNNGSNMDNYSLKLALFLSGGFMMINSVIFNWTDLDDMAKIIILCVSITGMITYTYKY